MAAAPDTSIEARLAALAKDIDSLQQDVAQDDAARKKLISVLQAGVAKAELPVEWIWRAMIMAPFAPAALMVLMRSGVLAALVAAGKPQTAAELSAATSVDEMLIIRFLRPLTAQGIFAEVAVNTYGLTPISELLATPPMQGGCWFMFDLSARSCANLPRYFEKVGYKHPDGLPGQVGPFQDVQGSPDQFFDFMIKNPEYMTGFNRFMSVSIENRPDWYHKVDAHALVLDGAKIEGPDDVLIVDIGGSKGHDLAKFRKTFPDVPGKLVLQDLPPVIAEIQDLDASILRMPHNFLEPQPVKGARLYYMRQIYHDWPGELCVKIMKNIAAAMVKGYSKLIIFEWILPERDVPLYPSLLDLNMMVLLNAKERTEREWNVLLERAGLKAIKFYNPDPNQEGIIEVELA